jgi:hypothetical protein
MGWRSKFIFLMLVYFAGFATAIYCLAPDGRTNGGYSFGQAGTDEQSVDKSTFTRLYDKACAKYSAMNFEEFKEKFRQNMQKLREMAGNSRTTAGQNVAEGG